MRKEASLELWEELYRVALELKALEPWNYFWDTDLVAIQLQEEKEPVFCSIMGRGGSCYGISVYEGMYGLCDFNRIARSEELGYSPEYVMFDQSNLTGYFGDREEVPAKQKKLIKELGLKFRGKNNWLYFESFKRRYIPYIPDEREVKLLIEAYKNLFMAVRAVKEKRLEIQWERDEILWRVYNEERKEWNMFAAPRPQIELDYPELKLQDDLLKARLRKRPKLKGDIHILVDFVYINMGAVEGKSDRPVNPLMFIAMEEKSGFIMDTHLMKPDEEEADVAITFFVHFLEQNGKMKGIKARNPWVFAALEDVCSYCGVELKKDSLRQVDAMVRDMRKQCF